MKLRAKVKKSFKCVNLGVTLWYESNWNQIWNLNNKSKIDENSGWDLKKERFWLNPLLNQRKR